MADVLVRNLSAETLKRLKQKAARSDNSLQQELHKIITAAAFDEVDALIDRVRERRVRYEAASGLLDDSARMVRRDRSR